MLPISNFTITLGKSKYYLRLACLLHVFAGVVLYNSSIPVFCQICLSMVLAVSLIRIARSRLPMAAYNQISRRSNYWLLHGVDEQDIRYEQAQISFDAGLFFLLKLTNNNRLKTLVIFIDQLSSSEYRALNVLGKISRKARLSH